MKKFLSNSSFIISLCVLLIIILMAIFAPLLAPHDPLAIDANRVLESGSTDYPLGTDNFGRDILSRMLYGLRPTLFIAVCATFLAMLIGTMMGMVAGFTGKIGEQLLMRTSDVIQCFPSMLLAIMIISFWNSSILTLIITLTIVYTPTFARLAYASTLKVKEMEYIEAQTSLGAGFFRILFTGVFPNIFSSILVQMSLTFGNAILLESGLSYLGLGIVPPAPSLGKMISDAQSFLYSNFTYLIYPAALLVVLILSINVLGDSLRDILDPRLNRD